MLPFLGSVLHMLTYSLPAILGPVGAAEENPLETDDESEKDSNDGLGVDAEPKSGAQATATYYAAVQVCMYKYAESGVGRVGLQGCVIHGFRYSIPCSLVSLCDKQFR